MDFSSFFPEYTGSSDGFTVLQGCIFSIIREYLFGYSLLDFFGWGRVCLESLDFS